MASLSSSWQSREEVMDVVMFRLYPVLGRGYALKSFQNHGVADSILDTTVDLFVTESVSKCEK